MVDLKSLIANSKNKQVQESSSAIASAEPTKETEKPKVKFNLKLNNSAAGKTQQERNSLGAKGNGISPTSVTNGIKTPKFSFSKATPPSQDRLSVAEGKADESVSDNVGKKLDLVVVDDLEQDSSPVSDEIGEIDVSDFVFKEQPEKFSQEAIDKLNGAIAILKECIDDKQQVGQAIVIIMKTLQDHPFLKDIMRAHPEHLGLMVRGLRESYGSVIVKKSANKTKRKAKETEVNKVANELDNLFGDILS